MSTALWFGVSGWVVAGMLALMGEARRSDEGRAYREGLYRGRHLRRIADGDQDAIDDERRALYGDSWPRTDESTAGVIPLHSRR